MKTKLSRSVAVLLAISLMLSLFATGSSVAAPETVGVVEGSTYTATDGSSYTEVSSFEDAVKLIENNPELYTQAAPAAETATEVAPVAGKPTAKAAAKTVEPKRAGDDRIPTIILPGISQSISYLANEDGTPYINGDGNQLSGGLLIIDESTIYQTLLSKLLVPLCKTLIYQQDMGFTDAVYDTICEVFAIQSTDIEGNPVNNLKTITYEYSIAEMTEDDRAYFYRMIPMQSVSSIIGEENLYVFAFPLIGDAMESAKKLDEYIQLVKEQRGVDKVNLISISLGGTILTAYLDLDNVDGSDINQVVNVVSLLQGCDLLSDFFARNFYLEDEFLYSQYIPMIMAQENDYGTYGYLINVALRLFPRAVLEKTLTRAVDGILDTLMLNCPQFWAMNAVDRYEGLAERYLNDEEHAVLRAKTDRFYEAQCNLEENLLKINNDGVRIHNICGYDLTFADYDYCFFGIMASSRTTNSDGIIDIDSTSLGATYATSNSILPIDYVAAAPGYLSPDGSIDASTCLFPDNVWFFYDQHHEVGRNDVVIKLAAKLISGEIESTADLSDEFPQFNGNRNTKNITRWYLGEAEAVMADPAKYGADEADIRELQEAYDEALALLDNTICNSSEADAVSERLLNALRRVGVRGAAEDQTTNKALEELTRFMDSALFQVLGAQGFSDWQENGIAITRDGRVISK